MGISKSRKRGSRSGGALRLWQEVYRLHSMLGAALDALGQELGGHHLPATGAPLSDLSRRELEVLALLREAHSAPEIARQLRVSVHTVRNHVRSIYRKLGVHSRAALLRLLR